MTFLYFLPKTLSTEVQNVKELHDAGITWIGPTDRFKSVFTHSGPGAQGGAMVSMGINNRTPGPEPVYRANEQTWRKHASGKFWVGIVTDKPPTPETLLRPEPIGGQPVKLLDGNEWIIPQCVPARVRGMAGPSLPMRLDVTDDDKIVGRPLPAFEALAEECHAFFRLYMGEVDYPDEPEAKQALFDQQMDLSVKLLGLNYRVGCRLEVISLLGLFSSDQWRLPLRAAIEADAIDRAMEDLGKKLEAEGPLSADSAISPGASGEITPEVSTSATSS